MEILNVSDNSFIVLLKQSEMEEHRLFTDEQVPCDREIVTYIKKIITANPMLKGFSGEKCGLIINAFSKNGVFELFVSRMEESDKASRKSSVAKMQKSSRGKSLCGKSDPPTSIYEFDSIDNTVIFLKRLYCCGIKGDLWLERTGSKSFVTLDSHCPFAGEYNSVERSGSFYGYLKEHCIVMKKGFAERLVKSLKYN